MDALPGQLHGLRLEPSSIVHLVTRERRFSDTDTGSAAAAAATPNLASHTRPRFTRQLEQHVHEANIAAATSTASAAPMPLHPHQCASPPNDCAVAEVFSMPELLATVFGFLDTDDIMSMRRVNRTFCRTVLESPRLRTHLFMRPQWLRPPIDFLLLDVKIPGLTIERGDPVEMGQWVHVTIDANAARTIIPTGRANRRPRARSIYEGLRGGLGSSSQRELLASSSGYEELHVAQPPLLGMQAFIIGTAPSEEPFLPRSHADPSDVDANRSSETTEAEERSLSACAKMSCHSGITLDFIADTALTLIPERRLASKQEECKVLFKAIVSFCEPTQQSRKRGTARSIIRLG
ncbi:hypothetical protein CERZMDRAFT_101935 [Cercospora zeae-maydis SCOH1-5]|uniref:F-box domain-containing protein n=1 Tax=Cercospora zeae-maydis SCOH1-5 TaxID=717836 RepID=A0A6A6F295_9PEZI|nr:hypothetical protein CERZMDRAFT_101935 [Cercospora zeae-maydis SCOH1-5]